MVEILFVEEGKGAAANEQVGWPLPSFLATSSLDSFLVTISTDAFVSDFASMAALDDDDDGADAAAATTAAGDGVGRFAATATPPPLLPSHILPNDDAVASAGDSLLASFSVALFGTLW